MLGNSEKNSDYSGEDGGVPISDDSDVLHVNHPENVNRRKSEESGNDSKFESVILHFSALL